MAVLDNELNEEQLLLLNNLMYFSGSANTGMTVEEIAQEAIIVASNYDKDSLAFSGGYEGSPEDMITIANAILADEELRNLVVTDSINTNGVRASCFSDGNGNATIATRGTGGTYEAWSDNFDGANQLSTPCQDEFLAFVQEQAQRYDDITVTGHSKGGNLAQYATILEGDSIDRCVSFDGQGFGDEFLDTYSAQIEEHAGKIKSISGDEDYVNILLNDLPGSEHVFLETTDGANPHSSFALWEKNQGTLIAGEYSELVEQSTTMKVLDKLADSAVDILNDCPKYLEAAVVNFLGSALGVYFAATAGSGMSLKEITTSLYDLLNLIISTVRFSFDDLGLIKALTGFIKELIEELTKLYEEAKKEDDAKDSKKKKKINVGNNVDGNFSIDVRFQELRKCERKLSETKYTILRLMGKLELVNLKGNELREVEKSLDKISKNLGQSFKKMESLENALEDIIKLYDKTEDIISSTL